jgi:hypothetical protein
VSRALLGRPVSESCSCLVGELVLHLFAAGQVLELPEEVLGLPRFVSHQADVARRPHHTAIGPQVAAFVLGGVVTGGHPQHDPLPERHVVWMGVLHPPPADQQFLRPAAAGLLPPNAHCRR